MKKVFTMLVFIAFIGGCKKTETNYQQELTGTWVLYKYLLHNADQTKQFETMYPGYAISFTAAGAFIITDSAGYANAGTYHFASNYQILALDDTGHVFVDSVLLDTTIEQQYTILNLTSASVQLLNDTSALYLQKLP